MRVAQAADYTAQALNAPRARPAAPAMLRSIFSLSERAPIWLSLLTGVAFFCVLYTLDAEDRYQSCRAYQDKYLPHADLSCRESRVARLLH